MHVSMYAFAYTCNKYLSYVYPLNPCSTSARGMEGRAASSIRRRGIHTTVRPEHHGRARAE